MKTLAQRDYPGISFGMHFGVWSGMQPGVNFGVRWLRPRDLPLGNISGVLQVPVRRIHQDETKQLCGKSPK
jgi:hypothetical protein